jgi:hypothetical protein
MGPMTGRGTGYCAGYDVPAYGNPMPGRGFGMGWGRGGGRGRGRRWRHWYYGRTINVRATGVPGWARFGYAPAWGALAAPYDPYAAPPTPEQETEFLKSQAEWLREQLDAITRRIEELEQGA